MAQMNRFTITVRWRSYRWTLSAIARSSVDLVLAMIDEFPVGSAVTVRRA